MSPELVSDCSLNLLQMMRIQYPNFSARQIMEHLEQSGNHEEAVSFQMALTLGAGQFFPSDPEDEPCFQTPTRPLPSVISKDSSPYHVHKGIHWPYYENILKLYALGFLIKGEATLQQQKDKAELTQAIESFGNGSFKKRNLKKKHLSAKELMEADSGVYLTFGKDIIRARAQNDTAKRVHDLMDLQAQIKDAHGENAIQLEKMWLKSHRIFEFMQERYK